MARATSLILATTLAGLAGPAAAQLCTSATAYPNQACPFLPKVGCIVTPGCLWNGTSAYGGVCSGGPMCTGQTAPGACSALLSCSWVPSTQPLTGITECKGDGTSWENPGCKLYEEPACSVTPGCNWQGKNVFGGWCTGGSQCTYDGNPVACSFTPGCSWVASGVVAVPLPNVSAPGMCAGAGAAFENPSCKFYGEAACLWTPGCSWGGRTAYHGWCSGGPQCTYLPSGYTCGVTPGCSWTAAQEPVESTTSPPPPAGDSP